MNMQRLDYIDHERLQLLPTKYWASHEFCFLMHDRMVQLLSEYDRSGVHRWVSDAVQKALDEQSESRKEINLVQFLKDPKLKRQYKHHLVSHLVLALTGDLLQFVYEALICFEKRKFSVGFSLLRKPLKENLLFLAWILGDTEDFVTRFEANNSKTLGGTLEPQRLTIFGKAIARLPIGEAFSPEIMHDLIFSKTNQDGFEPLWQRASHLITSQGALLKTEDYDINFVFDDPMSDHHYPLLYKNLPYVMIFTMQVLLECFALILKTNEKTVSHLMLTTMGCYESLFLKGSKQHIASTLNKSLKPFLKCIHCDKPFRINMKNAPSIYLHEVASCNTCGLSFDIPLYWLLAVGKAEIDRSELNAPILGI